MASREATPLPDSSNQNLISSTTPSRPPPQVPIRQSARKKVPIVTPGFVPTNSDSRRALQLQTNTSTSSTATDVDSTPKGSRATRVIINTSNSGSGAEVQNTLSQNKSQSHAQSIYNLTQDSDTENEKAKGRSVKNKADKKIAPRKDGTDSVLVYFKQIEDSLTYSCIWCSKLVKASTSSYYNLKIHRDGSNNKGTIQGACPNRSKAISSGCNLPLSAAEEANSKSNQKSGTAMANYVTKGRYDNNTLNKLLVYWLIEHSLPWSRFEDRTLRIALDYVDSNTKLNSRTWASHTAQILYLSLQEKVLDDIKNSESQISLVSDVWTTKGGHKAFLGISACYITKNWEYRSMHLSMKYISWHHKGVYLAAPFARVLTKNNLHKKITKTTDSGSNNLTMIKELSRLIKEHDNTHWDPSVNHQRCFCHVLALILGAGLRALKLSTAEGPTSSKPESFPTLPTIDEDGEPLDGVMDNSSGEELDPHNVAEGSELEGESDEELDHEQQNNPNNEAQTNTKGSKAKYAKTGIGFTLCKVVNQLLINESENGNGQYFKGYEFTSKEWENIRVLNLVLKEFLLLTKRMERDGPSCSMVLYEYSRLIETLEELKIASKGGILEGMFGPMIIVATKYKNLALKCEPILMATMLHPAWRLLLFANKFNSHHSLAQELFVRKFKEHQLLIKPPTPSPTKEKTTAAESEDDGYNFYPTTTGGDDGEEELNRYHETKYSLGIKGDVLMWWKADQFNADSIPFIPSLIFPC
ncbi:uncharacterized protein PGTG_17566 [Puccinia graminis f. sp. tritici CRL 75-36-700-3]|uniref:HAT C-terminal dimerisation domain-containing protein n=1 Tax=Puccinia graminis f. sp. tritici (strain CRL 75-36-700-3 / race SCCL) TaxID=418459 RepID=E3L4N7_PUCGT|nr:uncharacterized protein PGTG_17566 [Puccinia graminis f. sp. tritici CRL 75-36-700-3]EFP91512.1 hypothetical protein PGTG_17566 [Puccinia graminis f. sp. tritici CRL 75-36-700-3]